MRHQLKGINGFWYLQADTVLCQIRCNMYISRSRLLYVYVRVYLAVTE